MDDFKLDIFHGEIGTQCEFVLLASKALTQDLERTRPLPKDSIVDHGTMIWFWLQAILVSAANISKLLWGSEEADAPRADLRASLEVTDASPIRPKRVRNAFEHFDEFIEKMPNTIYIGRNIGPPSSVVISAEVPNTRFGWFDPATGDVTFWDRTANLVEVINEIERIYTVLREKHNYGA